MLPTSPTDVAHHAAEISAGNQNSVALAPDVVELVQELVVLMKMTELSGFVRIVDKVEVRW
jgi:hypothetical protein